MRVQKRSGELVEVRFDEITDRIKSLCYNDLDKNIDPTKISQDIASRITDKITTTELDNLSAQLCHSMSIIHPDYDILASRLIIDNHQKNCNRKFSDICRKLYYNVDGQGNKCSMISKEFYDLSMKYAQELDNILVHERDFNFDYFGFKTLERSYLLKTGGNKIVETPQHMWLRVSLAIHKNNLESVKETYDLLSQGYFTHATPTLFNSGTEYGNLASCFLLGTEDNIEGIFKTFTNCGLISKWAGGIGVHISNVRGNDSYIRKTGGKSNGIGPMLKVYNDIARYINQGGKRKRIYCCLH